MQKLTTRTTVFRNPYWLKTALLAVLMAGGWQCSTKKDALLNRTYHNITGHYNAYFNGSESFKEGVRKLELAEKDDYTEILPIFKYGTESSSKTIYPEMDNAILKASKVIQKHEIKPETKSSKNKKSKKKNNKHKKKRNKKGSKKKRDADDEGVHKNWIDDSYMLIGKANFYKRDFPKALESFEYVSRRYKKYPVKITAMIWIVKCHIEEKHFTMAQTIIDLIEDDKNKTALEKQPRKVLALLAATKAVFYLKQGAYGPAIQPMIEAIALTRKRVVRVRYTYILAQLYQQQRDFNKASRQFLEVLSMAPSYEMAFNAQISRAKGMSGKDTKEIKRELEKMLSDEKNSDYFDQVYYALADLAQREGNTEEVVMYLNQSIRASKSNNHQKGMAYLRLGNINFAKPDYTLAEAYYDSAKSNLDPDYPGYREMVDKKNSLKDIVKYLKIIAFEDSVQRLAGMGENERRKVIRKIIDGVIADERKKKEEEASPRYDPNASRDIAKTGGGWYFYNPTQLSFGLTEFGKKWGDRKLEDNWRRKNKLSLDFEIVAETDSLDSSMNAMEISGDLKDENSYLDLIPTTPARMKQSEDRLTDAYYNLGIAYKELMNDKTLSAETFEELLRRYPENKYELSCYYHLYRLFLDLGNMPKSNYYKNAILTKFPDSDYAKLINNPGYMNELKAKKNKLEHYYDDTYRAFRSGQYAVVISRCVQSDSLFPGNRLQPKFGYLRALAIGESQDLGRFEAALKEVVSKYPDDEVKPAAEETLALLAARQSVMRDSLSGEGNTMGIPGKGNDPENVLYTYEPGMLHYFVLAVPDSAVNIDDLKKEISDFNAEFFRMKNLKTTNLLLNTEYHLLLVKNFGNSGEGMDYLKAFAGHVDSMTSLPVETYENFIISSANFPVFYKEKQVDAYLRFFREKYR